MSAKRSKPMKTYLKDLTPEKFIRRLNAGSVGTILK